MTCIQEGLLFAVLLLPTALHGQNVSVRQAYKSVHCKDGVDLRLQLKLSTNVQLAVATLQAGTTHIVVSPIVPPVLSDAQHIESGGAVQPERVKQTCFAIFQGPGKKQDVIADLEFQTDAGIKRILIRRDLNRARRAVWYLEPEP